MYMLVYLNVFVVILSNCITNVLCIVFLWSYLFTCAIIFLPGSCVQFSRVHKMDVKPQRNQSFSSIYHQSWDLLTRNHVVDVSQLNYGLSDTVLYNRQNFNG